MLTRHPNKSSLKKFVGGSLKTIFLVEAAAFAVSYTVWYQLNTKRDFRLYMYKNHNWVLEGFYTIGEQVADQKTRELDQKVWKQENKI